MINTVASVLNAITLCISSSTCLMVLIICIIIIHHLIYDRVDREDKIVISTCLSIYLITLCCMIIIVSFNIQTFLGDLYAKNANSSWCISISYVFIVLFGGLLWAFVNQAFFRLCRIIYPACRSLQNPSFYIILTIFELIISGLSQSPLLFWHSIIYIPNDYFCYAQFQHLSHMFCLMFNAYGVQISFLLLIYFRITIYLRQQAKNQSLVIKQRQQRDLIVIRRIFIIIGALLILGIPTVVFIIMLYITGEMHPLFHRVGWLSVSSSMTNLSFLVIFLTPQLTQLIRKKFQINRV